MTETLATIRPTHGSAHNDVEELQLRRERGVVTIWMWTPKGPVLLRDTKAIRALVRELARIGFTGEQQTLEVKQEGAST